MISLNGAQPPEPVKMLRIIWFGGSIISDWNNPIATTNRATIRALQHLGHDVLFFEPRDSAPFMDALSARGSATYRAFQTAYPDIRYRRYDFPKRSSEGDVWLSRETALADVMVVQDDAPPPITDWLGRIPPAKLIRLFLPISGNAGELPPAFDMLLAPEDGTATLRYEPAVLPDAEGEDHERTGRLKVCYSNAATTGNSEEVVAAGAAADPNLPFMPDVLLPERYRQVDEVEIVDDDRSPFAEARWMLAVASGATVVQLSGIAPAGFTDARDQAMRLARGLIELKTARLHARGL